MIQEQASLRSNTTFSKNFVPTEQTTCAGTLACLYYEACAMCRLDCGRRFLVWCSTQPVVIIEMNDFVANFSCFFSVMISCTAQHRSIYSVIFSSANVIGILSFSNHICVYAQHTDSERTIRSEL